MARHKDKEWNLPEAHLDSRGVMVHSWESINAALLMDIRDELKRLNQLLHCPNFIGIPWELTRMRRGIDKLNARKRKTPCPKTTSPERPDKLK